VNEPEDYPDDITRLVDAYRVHYELPMPRAEAQRAWWRHRFYDAPVTEQE